MMKSILTYGATVTLTIVTFTSLALADKTSTDYRDEEKKITFTEEKTSMSLQQAIDLVLKKKGGQISKAEREREDGRDLYEIKGIDANGTHYKVYLNAANGQTLESHDDD